MGGLATAVATAIAHAVARGTAIDSSTVAAITDDLDLASGGARAARGAEIEIEIEIGASTSATAEGSGGVRPVQYCTVPDVGLHTVTVDNFRSLVSHEILESPRRSSAIQSRAVRTFPGVYGPG